MKARSWEALLKLVLLTFAGLILAQFATIGIASAFGYGFDTIKEMGNSFLTEAPSNLLKTSLFVSHIITFIIPGLLFAHLWYKEEKWNELQVNSHPNFRLLGIGILLLIVIYPAVSFSYTVNSWVPLPEWMHQQEATTMETMKKVLEMNNISGFLFSLILISFIPAIGEELIFRGLLQRIIEKGSGQRHLAVWVSSIVFSSFHLQFEGFLPRLLLGLMLGYLLMYTRNLWIPIIIHLLNNAIPIISLYFAGDDLASIDPSTSGTVPWYMGVISLVAGVMVVWYLKRYTEKHEYA